MIQVKIIGAGSIGNHLAQASRRAGFDVSIVDRDPKALARTKNEIYPTRYGSWDPKIKLFESGSEPKGGFDVIFIGTPPHVRMPIALEALKEKPRLLQLEKPLSTPNLEGLKDFISLYKKSKTAVVMGYDHAISKSINFVVKLLNKKSIGAIETLDVEFREYWGGIFKAHPWLSGPKDTYLGFTAKGGGASGEHSHALHLWQYLAHISGLGKWKDMAYVNDLRDHDGARYDAVSSFSFVTDKKKVGRVIQDVVTQPTRKWARIQGTNGFIEWYCNGHEKGDLVRYQEKGGKIKEVIFEKKRPDDFYAEILHIKDILNGKIKAVDSPVSFESGVNVMSVLNTMSKEPSGAFTTINQIRL